MEKQNDSIRERLLVHLPRPENLAAYREETASLLAKHEKALFWEKLPGTVVSAAAITLLIANMFLSHKIGAAVSQTMWFGIGILYFMGITTGLRYQINRSKVDLLKEIKQVQLQVLELQASIKKSGNAPGL
jgi:hypothetical protein